MNHASLRHWHAVLASFHQFCSFCFFSFLLFIGKFLGNKHSLRDMNHICRQYGRDEVGRVLRQYGIRDLPQSKSFFS
jgi:hypothetical protein